MSRIARQILVAGKRRIERGWGRGSARKKMNDGRIHYCATGALDPKRKDIMLLDDALRRAIMALWRALPSSNKVPYAANSVAYQASYVQEFNDTQSAKNGKRAIIRLYDRAIDELRNA